MFEVVSKVSVPPNVCEAAVHVAQALDFTYTKELDVALSNVPKDPIFYTSYQIKVSYNQWPVAPPSTSKVTVLVYHVLALAT